MKNCVIYYLRVTILYEPLPWNKSSYKSLYTLPPTVKVALVKPVPLIEIEKEDDGGNV